MEIKKRRVLLTGASSGIGLETAERLTYEGHEVYGIGREFKKEISSPLFHKLELDLRDEKAFRTCMDDICRQVDIDVLINNAGCAYYGLHESIKDEDIQSMVRVNLEVPMLLCSRFLPVFKQKGGCIINIASVTALNRTNTHGAAYGALKAGLLSFTDSIFEEARKCGVRVSCILPEMTATDLYRNADFSADESAGAALHPKDVADAVMYILNAPEGTVVRDVVLEPQLHRIKRR